MTHAMPAIAHRSRRLLVVGSGNHRITPDLHDRLMRLLDLLPRTRLIEIETDAGRVSVSCNCPCDRTEEVTGFEANITALPGITRLTLFQAVS